jgi:hypothetical protein
MKPRDRTNLLLGARNEYLRRKLEVVNFTRLGDTDEDENMPERDEEYYTFTERRKRWKGELLSDYMINQSRFPSFYISYN